MAPSMFDKMTQSNRPRIMVILAYAFLEWLLILLLFLISFLSFIVTKFAAYFGLKPFCTFCSRLDHIWSSKGISEFHIGHVCDAHGVEISRLGYCFSHRQLAGAKSLCGGCSFTDGMISGTPFRDPFSTEEGEENRCSCCDEVIPSREVCDPSKVMKPCWDVGASIAEVIDAEMDGEEASATVTDQSNSFSQGDPMKHDSEQQRTDFEECNYPDWRHEWNEGEDESIYITDMILQNEDYVDPDEFICIELLDTDNKPSTNCWEHSEEGRVELDKQLASLDNVQTTDAALLSPDCLETDDRYKALEGSDTEKGKAEAEGTKGRDDLPECELEFVANGHAQPVGRAILQHSSGERFDAIEFADIDLCDENESGKQSEMIDESAMQLHEKSMMCEKAEAEMEDELEGSVVSDVELEHESSIMEHLKLKVRAQNKALNVLYEELDEERKAAAVAANETMAMITKLQEEKATMRMEALQYQRMMEEQAEYDQEALQLLNDLMIKREREKQELEIELEMYRIKVLEYEAREKEFICQKPKGERQCSQFGR